MRVRPAALVTSSSFDLVRSVAQSEVIGSVGLELRRGAGTERGLVLVASLGSQKSSFG